MSRLWIGALCLSAPLVACGTEHRLDTSSDERLKASLVQVREALPVDRRAEFDQALHLLVASNFDMRPILASALAGDTDTQQAAGHTIDRVKSVLNGKTGSEIIASAEEIRREREARATAQALAEIEELRAKKTVADEAKKELKNFVVLRSRFYKEPQRHGNEQPIIELTVRNHTSYPVARAYFEGTLASPGRAVPWLRQTFNYQISGGLEPGEVATWSLAPNPFSDWGRVKAPADAILTLTVTRLDGADNKPLFSSNDFSERHAERLELLLKRYGEPPRNAATTSPQPQDK